MLRDAVLTIDYIENVAKSLGIGILKVTDAIFTSVSLNVHLDFFLNAFGYVTPKFYVPNIF